MKRWEEIIKEQPSYELTASTEAKVFAEMAGDNKSRRWWLQLAAITAGLAAVVTGYRLMTGGEQDEGESALLELAEEDLDLETLEDLDVIEILEELEQWQSS